MTRNVDGESIDLFINNLFAKGWYTNIHKWPEMIWLKENLISKGDVVFDCGANSGYTSVFFSRIVGVIGKVYAYEPHPLNIMALRKNTEINNAQNIVIIGAAVGSTPSKLFLSKHPNGAIIDRSDKTIQVDVVTLDDQLPLIKPDFIKIDVEGHEIEVLKGAKKCLKLLPKLDIEIHCASFSDAKNSVSEIFLLIDFQKYNIWIQLDPNGSITEFDPKIHSIENISRMEVVHIFAKPK